MKIAIVGTGYVGLVSGTCFSETGNHVTCIDIDEAKVAQLNSGKITIYEPGLEALFERNRRQHRLHFTTNLSKGIEGAEAIFLTLPTPPNADGSADFKYVLQVAKEIGPLLQKYTVIVDKSTVPVGTADKVKVEILAHSKVPFDVVSNPEFLREGAAVDDFMKPDRVVVGSSSQRARKLMENLYAPLVRQGNPIIFMDERSAELTKYAANAFLATKITFMNEIANLCEKLGADVDSIRKGVGTDSRIGRRFMFAGIGYGGSCFPKDVQALVQSSEGVDYDFKILKSVIATNKTQKLKLIERLKSYFNNDLLGKNIAIWGLSFKPYTDDIREAPSLDNINALLELGLNLNVYDPEALTSVKNIYGDKINYAEDEYSALENADALLILTEWPVFRTPDFSVMGSKMKHKLVLDGRNLYELSVMRELGFTYYSIGRNAINEQ